MNFITTIILFLVMLVIVVGAYALCRKYIFSKVKINKWIPLVVAIVLFIAQVLVGQKNIYISSVLSVLAVLFFLWFMDLNKVNALKKKEKQVVIRPKAKPNRVKKHNK